MSLLQPSVSYSTGQIVSPTRNLQSTLSGLGQQLNQYENRQAALRQEEANKRQEQMNIEKFQMLKDAEARKIKLAEDKENQNEELANIFRNINLNKNQTTKTSGSSNLSDIENIKAINAQNQALLEADVGNKGTLYQELFSKYQNENNEVKLSESDKSEILKQSLSSESIGDRPGLMVEPDINTFLEDTGIRSAYNSAKDTLGNMFSSKRDSASIEAAAENIRRRLPKDRQAQALAKLYENENVTNTNVAPTANTVGLAEATRDQLSDSALTDIAHERALLESGLERSNDILTSFTGKDIPELITKKGTSTTKSVRKSRSEFVKDTMNSIMKNDTLTGTTMLAAIGEIDKVANGIYGKEANGARGLTPSESLAFRKNSRIELEDQSTLISMKKMYPKAPKDIRTIDAMEAYIDREKSKKRKMDGGTKFVQALVDTDIDSDHSLKLLQLIDKYYIPDQKAASLIKIINDDYSIFPKWSSTVMNDFRSHLQDNYDLKQ